MTNDQTFLTRRSFFQNALTTAAACGLAQRSAANASDETAESPRDETIVDTQVYLGRWAFRQVSDYKPTDLIAALRKNNVSQAWVGTFDGLLHKDIAGANQRLVEMCRAAGGDVLIPFGTVNPQLPDWEEDVRRCHEVFHMSGIRLHPNYHGYKLDDPRFAHVLELAAGRNLVVQLVAWLDDERHSYLNPAPQQVDLAPLADSVRAVRGLRLVVANGARTAEDDAIRKLAQVPQVSFDFARVDNAASIAGLVELVSADRVVFGSSSPLLSLDAMAANLQRANLDQVADRAVRSRNAGQLSSAN